MPLLVGSSQLVPDNIFVNQARMEKVIGNGIVKWTRPYGLSNPVYVSQYNQAYAEAAFAGSVVVKPDGTKMFLLDAGSANTVAEFTLPTPYNPSGAVFVGTKVIRASQQDFVFKPDGTKMYVADTTTVETWTLSTPWLLSSATLTHTKTVGSSWTRGITWSNDGLFFFTSGTNPSSEDFVEKYSVSTAYDLSSTVTLITSQILAVTRQVRFSSDGLIMHGVSNAGSRRQYNLSSAYDITTAESFISIAQIGATNGGFDMMENGQSMMTVSSANDTTIKYNLSS